MDILNLISMNLHHFDYQYYEALLEWTSFEMEIT
jgi:hypothetical protein